MKKAIAITAYKCKKCGKIHFPFHDRCLGCKGREFEQIKPEGDATLLTYTVIFNLPWGFDQRFLVLGVAEFENHVKAMGHGSALIFTDSESDFGGFISVQIRVISRC